MISMSKSETEEKIETATADTAEAIAAQAENEAAAASAAAVEKAGEAAETSVAAAAAAAALAETQAARATQNAAETIENAKEDFTWLKNHAEITGKALETNSQRWEAQEAHNKEVKELLSGMMTVLQSSTPPTSENTPAAVNPREAEKNADGEGREKTSKSKQKPASAQRRWI